MLQKVIGGLLIMSTLNTTGTCKESNGDTPNLVPDNPSNESNYWCTWYAQNYWIKRGENLETLEGVTNQTAREELNVMNLHLMSVRQLTLTVRLELRRKGACPLRISGLNPELKLQ